MRVNNCAGKGTSGVNKLAPTIFPYINNQLIHNFLSLQQSEIGSKPPLFLSYWMQLWLAETSQQPISQTTWLNFTSSRNHRFGLWHLLASYWISRMVRSLPSLQRVPVPLVSL